MTSETTFSLKSICLMKREDERGMRGACVAPLKNDRLRSRSDGVTNSFRRAL
jgi:hypothetical protein